MSPGVSLFVIAISFLTYILSPLYISLSFIVYSVAPQCRPVLNIVVLSHIYCMPIPIILSYCIYRRPYTYWRPSSYITTPPYTLSPLSYITSPYTIRRPSSYITPPPPLYNWTSFLVYNAPLYNWTSFLVYIVAPNRPCISSLVKEQGIGVLYEVIKYGRGDHFQWSPKWCMLDLITPERIWSPLCNELWTHIYVPE